MQRIAFFIIFLCDTICECGILLLCVCEREREGEREGKKGRERREIRGQKGREKRKRDEKREQKIIFFKFFHKNSIKELISYNLLDFATDFFIYAILVE